MRDITENLLLPWVTLSVVRRASRSSQHNSTVNFVGQHSGVVATRYLPPHRTVKFQLPFSDTNVPERRSTTGSTTSEFCSMVNQSTTMSSMISAVIIAVCPNRFTLPRERLRTVTPWSVPWTVTNGMFSPGPIYSLAFERYKRYTRPDHERYWTVAPQLRLVWIEEEVWRLKILYRSAVKLWTSRELVNCELIAKSCNFIFSRHYLSSPQIVRCGDASTIGEGVV